MKIKGKNRLTLNHRRWELGTEDMDIWIIASKLLSFGVGVGIISQPKVKEAGWQFYISNLEIRFTYI